MTIKEIYQAYYKQYSYMPISKYKVELFLKEYPIFRTCEDLKYLVNMLYNWVGSQQTYAYVCRRTKKGQKKSGK